MRWRWIFALLFTAGLMANEDPFETPPALLDFALRKTDHIVGQQAKLVWLVQAFFAPVDEGGLGISYDNSYTRTVQEGYRDRKANCFTLTAMYIECCRRIGVDARYAESLRVSHWRRVGGTIRHERHIVAMLGHSVTGETRVADFLPTVTRGGLHKLVPVTHQRALSLFYSNRAAELMDAVRSEDALQAARRSVEVDPTHSTGWNVLGVVQRWQGAEVEAEASFRKAMAVNPTDGHPYGNLEDLLRTQGRVEEAAACRESAMEIRKKDPYFNAFLAQEALDSGQLEEADRRVRMALRVLPREPEFYLLKARISLAEGQEKAALKALETARKWTIPADWPRWDAKLALLKNGRG